MRTVLCIEGRHRDCGARVNRGTEQRPRLDDCSCDCHARPVRRSESPTAGTLRRWVKERDGYRCVARIEGVCSGEADHCHHLVRRGQGGEDVEGNLISVCFFCHDWIHANPAAATARGLLRSGSTQPRPGPI